MKAKIKRKKIINGFQLTQYNIRIEKNDLRDLKDLANDKETTVSHLIKQSIKKLLQNENL